MRTYWDTSAVINAAISPKVFERLDSGEHFTRLHTLAEFFANMTGRGATFTDKASGEVVLMKFNGNECASWLRSFAEKVQFVDVDRDDVLAALDKAQSLNVQGGDVYDYWHALAAMATKADQILTRNTKDFEPFTVKVQWP